MVTIFSPAKLNLTLRILGKQPNGYHDLCSCFLKLPCWEKLTIRQKLDSGDCDQIKVLGARRIEGENILIKVLREFRSKGWNIPKLDIVLWKTAPPGGGLGAGSGNAAALISWIEGISGRKVKVEDKASIGADVPFLSSRYNCAIVGGIGERVIVGDVKLQSHFSKLILIPKWMSFTKKAFELVDKLGIPGKNEEDKACQEALDLVKALNSGEKVGFLPNDFSYVLINKYPSYQFFFEHFKKTGANAWGISGSGSSCFALFEEPSAAYLSAEALNNVEEIQSIIVME